MATLRDPLFGLNNAPTAEWQAAEIEAQRPNALRGGWGAGRIGTDINALNADISSLRASGDTARADGLQREAETLRQQQANVAPRIGRLEDINGSASNALSWAAGQVGQGTASMVEPVAAATAVGGVGALMGMVPGSIGKAGRALRNFGAPAAALGINQRQLKGEFYGEASRDAELMARTSAQELNDTANMYGLGAGALDTVLPGIVGRQLTGAGLRKGLGSMGAGAKTLLGMGGEGATEAAQNYASQQTQGYLNPNRKTEGDLMENVNAFAGGAIGGGPVTAAGAMADAGYRRVGVTAEQIGAKTGEMMDLAQEKYEGSALQGGVDKVLSAGKQKAGDLMDLARDDDGNISLTRLAEAAGTARDSVQDGVQDLVQRYKVSAEERDILDMTPPAGLDQDQAKFDAWFGEASDKRTNFVAQRLSGMVETDPQAASIFERMTTAPTQDDQMAAADEGASYILQNNEIEQLQTRAERAAAAAGEFAMKGAGVVGKGAVAAGKAAAKFGKAVYDGAAGEMRKQNKQGEDPVAQGYAAWLERTDRATIERATRDGLASPDAAQARSRGDLFGEMLATEAQAALAQRGFDGQRMSKVTGLVRDVGYDIAHLASKGGPQGPGAALTVSRLANTLRTAMGPRAESIVDEMQALADPKSAKMFEQLKQEVTAGRGFTGRQQAAQVRAAAANQLVALLPPQDMQEILRSEAEGAGAKGVGAKGTKLNRAWLLDTIEGVANGHESPQMRKALNEKFGQETVAKMLELVGGALPAPPNAKYGVTHGGEESLVAATVNEDGEYEGETTAEGMTAFEQRQAEKNVAKGSGSKVYGFYRGGLSSLRGSTDQRDPFAPLTRTSKGATPDRPGLFSLTDGLSDALAASTPGGLLIDDGKGGKRRMTAIEKKIADMEKSLGVDRTPESMAATMEKEGTEEGAALEKKGDKDGAARVRAMAADSAARVRAMAADSTREKELAADVKSFFIDRAGSYVVGKQSAHDVMKELGFQPGKTLSVYRDYLMQDASKKGMDPAEKSALLDKAARVSAAVLDAVEQGGERKVFRIPAGERKQLLDDAKEYFGERYVAVAEKLSDRDPNRIEITEVLNMARAGAKPVEFARGEGDKAARKARQDGTSSEAVAEGKGKDVERALLDDANLITFQSDLMGTKNRSLHIRADTLVKWVRAQRALSQGQGKAKDDEYSNANKNQAFLTDLLEGINAVTASGLVDSKPPTRINAQGSFESFAKGIPPSLRLVTSTYGDIQWGKKERLEGITRRDPIAGPPNKNDLSRDVTHGGDHQEEVGIDQARNEEFFVADDLEGVEPPATYWGVREPKTLVSRTTDNARRKTMYADHPTFVSGPRQRKGATMDDAGNVARPAPYMGEASRALGTADPKAGAEREDRTPTRTFPNKAAADAAAAREAELEAELEMHDNSPAPPRSGDKATPLDFYPEQESGAVPDEFADQQFRTTNKATDLAVGPEPKMSAVKEAPERAAAIVKALRKDFAAGVAMLESRLRTAQRPEYIPRPKGQKPGAQDMRGAEGGVHYIFPVAHALGLDTIASLDLGPAEAKQLQALRAETAQVILAAPKLSDARKVALTRAMAPAASVGKVTAANYAKLLHKAAGVGKAEVTATPAAGDAPTGLLMKALDARMEYLTNPPADYTTAKGRAIADWAQRQLERIDARMADAPKGSEMRESLADTRAQAKRLLAQAASVLEGDASLSAFEGTPAAQEVAAVGAPKSQLGQSGAEKRTAPAEFTNHSGGALGADSMFDKVGRSLGFTKHNHYYHGNKTPTGNVALTQSQVDEGIVHAKRAAAVLARPWNDKYASLLGRNWFQVKNASQVIAVAPLIEPGELNEKGYASRAKRTTVGGGTGYAVEMAIANDKEVHVFDTKSNQWFAWDGQGFVASGVPALAKDYAGIGSRQDYGRMTPESIQAIRDVFEKALASKTDLWADTGGRKLNAQASQIHNDLKRGGFAATHDSPIRHEGKFNWREHIGKGEGNAAFGAGTYLSTAEGVHKSYKDQFSLRHSEGDPALEANHRKLLISADVAMMKFGKKSPEYVAAEAARAAAELEYLGSVVRTTDASPTYQVSVGIMQSQLMDWDKPVGKQSGLVRRALESIHKQTPLTETMVRADVRGNITEYSEPLDTMRAEDVYKQLARKLGSQAKASERLQAAGILGHRYAASGGKNDTHPNYVVYDDSKITTNYVHFNAQDGNARVATQVEMDEAKAYVKKVLGPQIKVEFKDITGYSGEWLDAEQAIHISTTAGAGILSTAYHEAMHGFFSKFVKSDPRVLETLKSLAENDKILARVAALLAKHPAALEQLKSGEERLAYIYQFWAAGKLGLPMGKPRTVLQKVRKFFRRVLGLVKDSERAVALFEAFHEGKLAEPSAAGRVIAGVLDEGTGVLRLRRKMDGVAQWLAAKVMPAETILATSESKAAQALAKEFFTNPGDGSVGKEAEGYLNARRRMAARYNNTFAQAIQGLSDRDMTEVAGYLQQEADLSDIDYAPHREAVGKIRNLLQRFYRYMSDERGLELGHAGEKYYPRVWNTALLHQKKDQFVAMLTEHYGDVLAQGAQGSKGQLSEEQVAERIWRALIDREGVNDKLDAQRQDGVLAPFFASKENRTLAWLQGEHAEPFLEKSLVGTLSRYFHQGVRAAEYTDRFGVDGEHLEKRLMEVHNELVEISHARAKRKEFKDDEARAKWVRRQYRDVAEAVGAMEGTLGKDISPGMRKLNSYTTVYQNVRLLPLSLFSSFVDPLGMVARGATMTEAYEGFLRGMKEVVRTWGDMFREEPKERQADKWERLAEHVGAVDVAMFDHFVSDAYSSVYMERGAKKINDTMFKLNGMEAWNRGMRVAGTKSAVKFIERHSKLPGMHSARWLQELGLDPKNIPLDGEGNLITDKSVLISEKGVGKAQAEREIDAIHYAINRWVEGAILTPNAAQRPAWGSDPHYSMFFHLKQFSYSFHQTLIKRAVQEMNHGNLAPLGAFVWYIPTMIAADITKGLIQGGGELPAYMKGMDLGDHVMRGVRRSGALGIAQLGVDAGHDMFSLAGPAAEQMVDAMVDPLERTLLKAAPAHGLYAEALR